MKHAADSPGKSSESTARPFASAEGPYLPPTRDPWVPRASKRRETARERRNAPSDPHHSDLITIRISVAPSLFQGVFDGPGLSLRDLACISASVCEPEPPYGLGLEQPGVLPAMLA